MFLNEFARTMSMKTFLDYVLIRQEVDKEMGSDVKDTAVKIEKDPRNTWF